MKKVNKVAIMLSIMVLASSSIVPTLNASADACRVVTLGADLSEEQKETVLEFFNTNETEVQVIEVNNEEEHQYLDGIVDSSVIGSHTLSCCYINPTTEGGILVKTANLNWVTDSMLANALVTAGVTNCEIVATAPFEVSGTGALVGILKAYETASDTTLDEDKKESATEELVLSAELSDDNNEDDVLQFMNEVKTEALGEDLDEDALTSLITETADKYGIKISDEIMEQLKEWLTTFKTLSYDIEQFTAAVNQLNDTIQGVSTQVSKGTTEAKGFFAKIAEFFKNLFAKIFGSTEELKDTTSDFFDNLNTDVFTIDGEEATVGSSD